MTRETLACFDRNSSESGRESGFLRDDRGRLIETFVGSTAAVALGEEITITRHGKPVLYTVTRPKADVRKAAEDMRRFQKEHARTLGPELSLKELIETDRRTFRERFILLTLALITNPLAKGGED